MALHRGAQAFVVVAFEAKWVASSTGIDNHRTGFVVFVACNQMDSFALVRAYHPYHQTVQIDYSTRLGTVASFLPLAFHTHPFHPTRPFGMASSTVFGMVKVFEAFVIAPALVL